MFRITTAGRALRATALAGALVAATLTAATSQTAVAGASVPTTKAPAAAPGTTTAGAVQHAAKPAAKNGAKPTIVLVHGAWADGSSWNGVISRLQHDGYTVDAPPNPQLGLAYDTATLKDFLGTISGPVVLVGHSYGGEVITNAATGNANVKALVYVDAFVPDQGQTLAQLATAVPGSCTGGPNLTFAPYPGAPAGAQAAYLKQSAFPGCMANGLPLKKARQLAAAQRPLATVALTDVSGVPAWKTIPSWAVVGTADHAIPPAEQLAMARNAHARITTVHAPHLSMIKRPHTVTSVILQAVHATT
ncbi:alpha/beta fold hydrolase [Microlunatus flavus]|uniref:Pimeloyl-ACP methyl ester carboxylesterase n=1 Tax=Microlunatus flavus TaxID=1036181 RepID=A0A1H9FSJ4_9ACTN|nr:alpha/beta hydrolase [Microlunatus flavus]SEQ40911.1 Pimeloyl-ACP methyl ester carboxylesterase [Microlunatus flavus]